MARTDKQWKWVVLRIEDDPNPKKERKLLAITIKGRYHFRLPLWVARELKSKLNSISLES
jgi:hypothetical protein